ncbi:MAG: hypothetical protein R3F40_07980 [Candidatus Competibacteraceae bacterium]
MLAALFALSQVPLSVSPTCAGVGTERGDATLGQYLSGFLAELSNPEASNAITTSAVEEQSESGIMIWICSVMIRHARGEDIWSWGIEFSVPPPIASFSPIPSAAWVPVEAIGLARWQAGLYPQTAEISEGH